MRHSPLATTAVLASLLAASITGANADPSIHRHGRAPSGGPRIVYGIDAPSSPSGARYTVAQGYGEPAAVVDPIGFPSGGYRGYAYGYPAGHGFAPPIPPAGGLAVYSPGAYGPGPRIIHIPRGYGTRPNHRMRGRLGASAGFD